MLNQSYFISNSKSSTQGATLSKLLANDLQAEKQRCSSSSGEISIQRKGSRRLSKSRRDRARAKSNNLEELFIPSGEPPSGREEQREDNRENKANENEQKSTTDQESKENETERDTEKTPQEAVKKKDDVPQESTLKPQSKKKVPKVSSSSTSPSQTKHLRNKSAEMTPCPPPDMSKTHKKLSDSPSLKDVKEIARQRTCSEPVLPDKSIISSHSNSKIASLGTSTSSPHVLSPRKRTSTTGSFIGPIRQGKDKERKKRAGSTLIHNTMKGNCNPHLADSVKFFLS